MESRPAYWRLSDVLPHSYSKEVMCNLLAIQSVYQRYFLRFDDGVPQRDKVVLSLFSGTSKQ